MKNYALWAARPGIAAPFARVAVVTMLLAVGPFPELASAQPLPVIDVGPAKISPSIKKKISARLKQRGFVILPDALTALQSKTKAQSRASAHLIEEYLFGAVVSGNPPTLASLDRVSGSAIDRFWRPDVVETIAFGSPSGEQCGEFFIGPVDGQSGGLGACLMAEGVGRSFEIAIDAAKSVCQMRNFGAKVKIDDPAILFTRGRDLVPGGALKNLFNPGDEERLIKIRARGEIGEDDNGNPLPLEVQNIFIRIAANETNRKRNAFYRADLHFCEDGDTIARGYNLIRVSTSGVLSILNKDSQPQSGRAATAVVKGRLTPVGATLRWSLDAARTGEVQVSDLRSGQARSERIGFVVSQDGVTSRRYRESSNEPAVREYAFARIQGNDAVDLRFLSGAFKSQFNDDPPVVGATEYRDSYYASAPQSPLVPQAQGFEFSADPIFAEPLDLTVDLSKYRCALKPDIEIEFDRSKIVNDFFDECESRGLKRMDFCSGSELVETARQRQSSVCSAPLVGQ